MSAFGLKGVGVSRGVAIGKAWVLHRNWLDVEERSLPANAVEAEVRRFEAAVEQAKTQLAKIRERIPATTAADITSFIDTHLLMMEDKALSKEPANLIRERCCNAEWALKLQRDAVVAVFEEMDDPYLRTRKDDIDHVVTRIQRILLNKADRVESENRRTGCVIVADDLSPADTVNMQSEGVAAFVTEFGGPTSHTTILARSLGIPAVVGVRNVLRFIQNNDKLIVDGRNGVVLSGVDAKGLAVYRCRQEEDARYVAELRRKREKPAISKDGTLISVHANVELPEDIVEMKNVAVKGIGLYRTEYLFLNRETLPDEEEQYQSYFEVLAQLNGAPLTLRTLDLGADKAFPVDQQRNEVRGSIPMNPALGLRAIRLCLRDPGLFLTQLRAILRVSAHGHVNLMIPMLSCVQEVLQSLSLIEQAKRELTQEGIDFDEDIAIGGMIEVPAAALSADALARHLDFFSIGTNDLIQYAMAADRLDNSINYLYQPLHPGIIRLIGMTIKAGHKAGIPVSMCGEMAGEARFTRLLLGIGLREFSMQPSMVPEVKDIIRNSDIGELRRKVSRMGRLESSQDVERLVERLNESLG